MRKPVIAVKDYLMPRFAPLLADRYALASFSGAPIADARALVTTGGGGASAAEMDALPALEIIAADSVGYEGIDVAAARARGVRVTNTPDVLTEDVADLAIALMIAVARGIAAGDRYVRAGAWAAGRPFALGRTASGRRVGIAGLGRIGKAIARRLEPMGATISYTGRTQQAGVGFPFVADLVALARTVEVLILVLPASRETEGLVDAAVLDALGPEGILINVGRGSVVDEAALVAALVEGRLGGAGLDVFADEPHVPEALLGLDNVVLQPHRGSATDETRAAMAQLVADNLDAHFAGRPLRTPVA